ncbi:hypothetical protein PSQ90_14240 [Devosia rhodophyticola]|uniref:Tetratricopeptide repeat protein n=1 Tax=Devosia rhodophyticola TaxID=3026423 RepID=A0ABY7YW62_9HYPH|nr:hypothetical protein [Devosia rhodophyticola]WDR05427.1 hypothetical protein PSQ90_14240 [Devosia rhodophyticola]
MKTALQVGWKRARLALIVSVVTMAGALVCAAPGWAQDRGQLSVSAENGFGRMIVSFRSRTDLPAYKISNENGVLSVTFDEAADVILPDVGGLLSDYVTAARADSDKKGIRFGLRAAFEVSHTEADNQLYIDLLPSDWQGAPPTLPQDVQDRVASNAKASAKQADRKRKAEVVRQKNPQVTVRVGTNPTFMRLQFDWSLDTKADFSFKQKIGVLDFEWPVAVDVAELASSLPPEIVDVKNNVTEDGSDVMLKFAAGVEPRFYEESPRSYTIDVDLPHAGLPPITAQALVDKSAPADDAEALADISGAGGQERLKSDLGVLYPDTAPATIQPYVSMVGTTLRVVFPFEQDTAAAVFRRGNTVWTVIDTASAIEAPKDMKALSAVARDYSVISGGDTQVVRIDLGQDRLATLGSEGRAWVLSLGDMVLTPTEPIDLKRQRTAEGGYEMVADVERPARVHQFVDPVVGDKLEVVTAYPPARGMLRDQKYVDFTALRTVHGLAIKPQHDGVDIQVENKLAIISTEGGLTLSSADQQRALRTSFDATNRFSFIDLDKLLASDPAQYEQQYDDLTASAASAKGSARDAARLDLAQYQLANGFAYEALGVLSVIGDKPEGSEDLVQKVRLTTAIADTVVNRSSDALAILNSARLANEGDALLWRTIARADSGDYRGALEDGLASEDVARSYPAWAKKRFTFAAIRAAVETDDIATAQRLLDSIDTAELNVDEVSQLHLLMGRTDELKGQDAEAIDNYGQVIAADIRPTRAEAIYRTMLLLDKQGNLNLEKATATLSAEAMLWRGNALEASMQQLLAKLYFRRDDYRSGFETVKQAVSVYPESREINALRDQAQQIFVDLFLNGQAEALAPVDALSLFYDFRELTPPGARGDEMIRNLARRLVKIDLLPQAAQLLDYQLSNRLKGAAKAQVAADLAIIYLADRKPQDALRVLGSTRMPDLSEALTRQRRVLEARSMIDGGRDELALDLLKSMQGRDVDQLRVDAHWRAKRYGDAAELLETMYAPNDQPLSQPARMNVIKAAVGYVLAGDRLGQSRLRAKFAEAMVTAPEWPMFDYVTGTITTDSLEFKKVASAVSGLDGLSSFLAAYRETYGTDGAMVPPQAARAETKVAGAG